MKKNIIATIVMAMILSACHQNTNQATSEQPAASSNTAVTASSEAIASDAQNNDSKKTIRSVDIRKDNLGGDFTLTDGQGKPFSLSDLKGKVVILAFGFTNCPDVCPTELFIYSEALQQLGEQADNVKVVFVSVDPERDTPELIGRYAAQFNPNFIGLTDTKGGHQLALAKQLYQIVSAKTEIQSDKIYNMDHTAGAYLLDKNGDAAYFAPYGIEAPQLAEDLKTLLAQ